ncbi:MAG: hypothetical protein AAB434_11800 [Planctomycetota bacterium]
MKTRKLTAVRARKAVSAADLVGSRNGRTSTGASMQRKRIDVIVVNHFLRSANWRRYPVKTWATVARKGIAPRRA